ncbi:MAG: [FeFe] hydrogenase H-cluster radical SAM maturase HydE [Syntrophomonadaceae bacterium]|jgi:biotin synthase
MTSFKYAELYACLSGRDSDSTEALINHADLIRRQTIGDEVYLRGLIEYSNYCCRDCFYCGLRRGNRDVSRYKMNQDQIVEYARQAYQAGFHSLAIQSGEINDKNTVDNLVEIISMIKSMTGNDGTPGLGITLSVGELSYKDYERLFAAGAHRYLLRIETSNPELFARLHPPEQSLQRRIECLQALKAIGYQVGTGVMAGLPGQTIEDLVSDLQFFLEQDIDMLGLGPYIAHPQTPLYHQEANREIDPLLHTLKMMALARILMPDINMVASTALQSLHANGLSWGLKAGANIVMPVITPPYYREKYSIYSGKQYKPFQQIQGEIEAAGYQVGLWKWGDSPHWHNRRKSMVR